MGNGEAKELICTTHGHELRGRIAGGNGGTRWRGTREEKWDNSNSIVNKIYLKIDDCFVSFVDYVPVKGDIIWYLSLTAWLISFSIMLSSSIHAIAKGVSSFFPSAA